MTGLTLVLAALLVLGTERSAYAQTTPSTLEIRRAEAATIFGARLHTLSQTKQQVLRDRGRYKAACFDRVTKGRFALDNAILLDRAIIGEGAVEIRNETTPECRMLAKDIVVNSANLQSELSAVEEEARRKGIYAGIMRDLREQYDLGADIPRRSNPASAVPRGR